jgi:hypothetical protein
MTDVQSPPDAPDDQAPDDPITPEVMPEGPEPGAEVDRWDAAAHAIEAAADAALSDPTLPGRNEFLNLCVQARMLSLSDLAPDGVRGKPYNALLLLLTARELGIGPAGALRTVYVVDGRPTLAPKLLNALLRRKGLGYIVPHPENSEFVGGAVPYGPDGQQLGPPTVFRWQDAQIAGLAGMECQPDDHKMVAQQRKRRDGSTYTVQACGCKDNYRNYPGRMLWQRARGYCVDDYFPEVGLGLYSPDEMGAITDDDGNPLDPGTVELPPGYVDPEQERAEHRQAAEGPAPADDLQELWIRLRSLPEGMQDDVRERWTAANLPACHRLNSRQYRTARSMINGFEAKAKSQGVDLGLQRQCFLEELGEAVTIAVRGVLGPIPVPGAAPAEGPMVMPDDPQESPPEPPHAPESDPDGVAGGDTPEDPPAATQGPDEPEREQVDWSGRMIALAQEVRDVASGVESPAVAEVEAEVKGLHHTKLAARLSEYGHLVEDLAGSPVDFRRMLLTRHLLADRRGTNPVLEQRANEEPF